jgi:hypothetical protein
MSKSADVAFLERSGDVRTAPRKLQEAFRKGPAASRARPTTFCKRPIASRKRPTVIHPLRTAVWRLSIPPTKLPAAPRPPRIAIHPLRSASLRIRIASRSLRIASRPLSIAMRRLSSRSRPLRTSPRKLQEAFRKGPAASHTRPTTFCKRPIASRKRPTVIHPLRTAVRRLNVARRPLRIDVRPLPGASCRDRIALGELRTGALSETKRPRRQRLASRARSLERATGPVGVRIDLDVIQSESLRNRPSSATRHLARECPRSLKTTSRPSFQHQVARRAADGSRFAESSRGWAAAVSGTDVRVGPRRDVRGGGA